MVPMRLPSTEPKIRKYRLEVMTEGRNVCTHMRNNRTTSLRTIV